MIWVDQEFIQQVTRTWLDELTVQFKIKTLESAMHPTTYLTNVLLLLSFSLAEELLRSSFKSEHHSPLIRD
jgi:hypothetical protein